MPRRKPSEYGLTAADRRHEVERRFGAHAWPRAQEVLARVVAPTEQVLGAIVFLARHVDDLPDLVDLANSDAQKLLNAATVKDERG
jgi:hypothetical protein